MIIYQYISAVGFKWGAVYFAFIFTYFSSWQFFSESDILCSEVRSTFFFSKSSYSCMATSYLVKHCFHQRLLCFCYYTLLAIFELKASFYWRIFTVNPPKFTL